MKFLQKKNDICTTFLLYAVTSSFLGNGISLLCRHAVCRLGSMKVKRTIHSSGAWIPFILVDCSLQYFYPFLHTAIVKKWFDVTVQMCFGFGARLYFKFILKFQVFPRFSWWIIQQFPGFINHVSSQQLKFS